MVTSGTTAFNLDILDIVEEAYEMIGMEVRGGYDLRSARRSLNLLTKEWGNRGLNMWTLNPHTVAYTTNEEGLIVLPSNIIDVLDAAWRDASMLNDSPLNRQSGSMWMQMANKRQTGSSPSLFMVERTVPPKMRIWPIPTTDGTLILWALRQIEDAGAYTNTVDIVPRFLPALTAGLAYYLAIKSPNAVQRVPMLQAEYERQFTLAAEEDRERSSFFMLPDLSSYNR